MTDLDKIAEEAADVVTERIIKALSKIETPNPDDVETIKQSLRTIIKSACEKAYDQGYIDRDLEFPCRISLATASEQNLSGTTGTSEAANDQRGIHAACFPATSENKTTRVQLPTARTDAAATAREWEVQHEHVTSNLFYVCYKDSGQPVVDYGFDSRSSAQAFADAHSAAKQARGKEGE